MHTMHLRRTTTHSSTASVRSTLLSPLTLRSIDEGELVANDTLKTAMEQTALKLSTVESLDDALYKDGWEANTDVDWTIDNDAYTSDRFFNDYNRVFTSNDNYELATKTTAGKAKIHKPDDSSAAKSHKELKEAYEALLAEAD